MDSYPPDRGTPVAEADDHTIMVDLLHALGRTVDHTLTMPQTLTIIREDVPDLQELNEDHIRRVILNTREDQRIVRCTTPGHFAGDIHHFPAAESGLRQEAIVERWGPYCTGRLDIHSVISTHVGMAQPGPLAQVGAVLAAVLARRTT